MRGEFSPLTGAARLDVRPDAGILPISRLSNPPVQPSMQQEANGRGKWMALLAALLGWLFDGFEMGLFPLVGRPALRDLLRESGQSFDDSAVGFWFSIATAAFLIGAAAGGVVFGWLGDRIGRVRAMTLSILTYALCSGMGGFAAAPWHMVVIRFIAALGMGGEWSLGVALVMEVWGGRSRALLAGLIGAAANVGYMLVSILSLGLGGLTARLRDMGLSDEWVNWRLLTVCGALPALLTFFIRLMVPESERWEREKARGATSSWASSDLLAVLGGVGICTLLLFVWRMTDNTPIRLAATFVATVLVAGCFLVPIFGYLRRAGEPDAVRRTLIRSMLLGALICGIPLLGTWGCVQWASVWADQLAAKAAEIDPSLTKEVRHWKEYTQLTGAFGAVVGCLGGALLAGWIGRRIAYCVLCVTSFAAVYAFYQVNTTFDATFVVTAFLAGTTSAAFYGWIPLYLPELFPTRVRATAQGFAYNFGRILAAVGVLQVPALMGDPPNYATACSWLAFIYVAGLGAIWLLPETMGKALPE
jgi:MFS transporter, SHS family, sialic acid transporter